MMLKKRNKKITRLSRTIGMFLSSVLLLVAIVFSWVIYTLNMLPMDKLMLVIGATCVFTGIIFVDQALSSSRGIPGKVIAVFLIVGLSVGSFYLYETNKMLENISNNSGLKINHMLVVVRIDDKAESIKDAMDYNFGVQYMLQKEDITRTVIAVESEVDQAIAVKDCVDISGQAEALLKGEVDAIIYNEAYSGIIEEVNPEYSGLIKVLYTHDIEQHMEETKVDMDVTRDSFCIYISGIDVFGSISKNSRSDVNILAYVNPSSKQVLLVNTPRDYYLAFPGITGGEKDKLTHAGIYGVDESMRTLEELYDMEIQYYARVNFTSLVTMVDALGGIEVYSEESFTTYKKDLTVYEGYNTFTGNEALSFSRERYNVSGGDSQRGRNQQAVITAMINKVISPAIITGATSLIASVNGNVDTNMSQADIQALIKMQISEGGSWNVKSIAATGTADRQYCYSYPGKTLYVMQPDMTSIFNINKEIQKLYDGDVLID